ncbi:MAG TPA: Na+/H+ antiporter NhaA [Bauldia sp.]|nr:Na+/H+ antiporter NhaA [Bauldia sp.]
MAPIAPRSSRARRFLRNEVAGGLVLLAAAALALIVANTGMAQAYDRLVHLDIFGVSLLHAVNDGLMTVFFLLVGLEIKRELVEGELSTWPRRVLPGLAAAGGMLVPALIFVGFNAGSPETLRGWAVPSATDIAFSLAVLAILGSRVPPALKVLLTALAILDDLGAVLIIALFYGHEPSLLMLGLSLALVAILFGMNLGGVKALSPYLALGAVLWFCVLKSGVHATVAGVLLAATIPIRGGGGAVRSPLRILEHCLQPYVNFLVLPVFAFVNAGVTLGGIDAAALASPVTLGAGLGLFVGKQVGISGAVWAAVRARVAHMPAGTTMLQLYGMSLLCGIGFTMSLFIGLLAFGDSSLLIAETKIGVLAGSVLSALAGWLVLRLAKPRLTAGS